MPNLAQSLNVLRNGIPKPRSKKDESRSSTHHATNVLPIRDHYLRYEYFHVKQYPKLAMRSFATRAILRKAEIAARETPLGIIDTLAREYLTYWFPETEAFLDADPSDDFEDDAADYKRLATGLIEELLSVLGRIDCDQDKDASGLRDVTMKHVQRHLERLNDTCGDIIGEHEMLHFTLPTSPLPVRSKNKSSQIEEQTTTSKTEVLSEARILNSSTAWDLRDAPSLKATTQAAVSSTHPPSPRKRGFEEARLYDDYEAADNGQAWTPPGVQIKRQKFEVKFSRRNTLAASKAAIQHKEFVIDLTDENAHDTMDGRAQFTSDNNLSKDLENLSNSEKLSGDGQRQQCVVV